MYSGLLLGSPDAKSLLCVWTNTLEGDMDSVSQMSPTVSVVGLHLWSLFTLALPPGSTHLQHSTSHVLLPDICDCSFPTIFFLVQRRTILFSP